MCSQKKKDIILSATNYKFISDLDDFLMNYYLPKLRRTLERNTVNQHHTRLRTILLRAVREGVLSQNPYNDFKLTDEEKPPRYLTEQELQLIINHNLGDNPSLQRVRDIFIFSVYTGLRFTDAQKLKFN
jgi:integrase